MTNTDNSRRKDDARPAEALHWDTACSICAGAGTTFGKTCVCRAADERRATFTEALRIAALELLEHNAAAGACIEIPGEPPLYVLVGAASAIGKLLPEGAPVAQEGEQMGNTGIPQAVRIAGAKMANTMFNLAQRPGELIDSDLAVSMDKMCREWDLAISASAQAATADVRDAARYRWLRDGTNNEGPNMVAVYGMEYLDKAIDAALRAASAEGAAL